MFVFQNILKLEAKLESFQDDIKQKIEDSFKSENMENVGYKENICDDNNNTLQITIEIKKYFKDLLKVNSPRQGCSKDTLENLLIRPASDIDELESYDDDFDKTETDSDPTPTDDANTIQIAKKITRQRMGRPKGTTKKYQCDQCNCKVFENKKAFIRHHVQIHKKEEKLAKRKLKEEQDRLSSFNCHVCSFQTKYRNAIKRHVKMHEMFDDCKEVDGEFQCKYCDALFPGSWGLKRHIMKKHGNEAGLSMHNCPNCDETFSQKVDLNCHLAKFHTQEFRYFCEICGFKTVRSSSLAIHMKTHDDNTEKSFICELCAAPFKTKHYLSLHKIKVHNRKTIIKCKQQVHLCKYCNDDNKFLNKSLLDRHLKDKHKDLYVHKCDECENSYMSVASLQLHKKINHNVEQAECQFCGSKVFNRVYLYNHFKYCQKKPDGFMYKYPRN